MELDTLGVALAAERITQSHREAERARLARQARRTGRRRDHGPAQEPKKEAAMAVERTAPWEAAPESRPAPAVEASGWSRPSARPGQEAVRK